MVDIIHKYYKYSNTIFNRLMILIMIYNYSHTYYVIYYNPIH